MFRLSRTNEIHIDITARSLTLWQSAQLLHQFPIAIGKASTPTPLGQWQVINKKILTDPSIFGSRWIGLSAHGYGIHGTNNPAAIGSAVSLGCIRMHNRDVETLFPLVSLGTPVTISAQAPAFSQQASANGRAYTVRLGDTPWSIAQSQHIALAKLLALNPQAVSGLIVGEVLRLPPD